MISTLTGTLAEVSPTSVVLDVGGVGFEVGVSSTTSFSLPQVGEAGVHLYTRMIVRESDMTLFGFATREERAVFDKLCTISGVGPRLALSVLSTFSPDALADVVIAQDATRMATVPGVGKKLAGRMLLELEGAFSGDADLRALVGGAAAGSGAAPTTNAESEAVSALLSMGFTQREVELALEGYAETGATTTEAALAYALRKLGGGQ